VDVGKPLSITKSYRARNNRFLISVERYNYFTMKYLSTSKVAQIACCHPNTVRLYEKIGYLQPAIRSENGYRLFTAEHADQMVLARRGLDGDFAGVPLRDAAKTMIMTAAGGDLGGALDLANLNLDLSTAELEQARITVSQVEQWVNQDIPEQPVKPLNTTSAARLLDVTVDSLRTWERNDLIRVPRSPDNGYRLYGPPEILRLRIIRMLRTAGYSLMAIYRMLKKLDSGQTRGLAQVLDTPGEEEDFFTAADRWITTLTKQEEKAKDLIGLLEARIQKNRS
jgi:DNA-binding transcriptional MerR regulator